MTGDRKTAQDRRHGRTISLQGSTIQRIEKRLAKGESFSGLVDKLLNERLDQLGENGDDSVEARLARLEAAVLPQELPSEPDVLGFDSKDVPE